MDVSELATPTLVVYLERVENNCQVMRDRCKEFGAFLRPHFKTSKAVQVAELMTGGSRRGIVVSTVAEAEHLADNGFDDILYAYPFATNKDKIKRCSALNERLSEFHVMVDDLHKVDNIIALADISGKCWSVFINVDCGGHREGVLCGSNEVIEMAKRLHSCDKIKFQGLYTHSGHSYWAGSTENIQKIVDEVISHLLALVERLKANGVEVKHYGVGSTPTCSQPTESMRRVTEWHPGNHAFYDVQQLMLGSCKADDIACAVATRVIGHYGGDGRNYMLIDCGFMALTLQGGGKVPSGGYGIITDHPELKLEGLTQEIGKVTTVYGSPLKFENYPVGKMFFVLPYHSCATCGMHPVYHVINNEGKVVDKWTPVRGW